MTDGIGRIGTGNGYGINGFVPQRHEAKEEVPEQPIVQQETEQVDPERVMDLLANKNIFVAPKTSAPAELSPAVKGRVEDAMARFEEIYAIVEQEFGPELASTVMDLVMDKLMGLV